MHQFAVYYPLFGRWVGKGLVTTQRFGFSAQTSPVSENCCEHVTAVNMVLLSRFSWNPCSTQLYLCQQIQLQAQQMASCTENQPYRHFPSVFSKENGNAGKQGGSQHSDSTESAAVHRISYTSPKLTAVFQQTSIFPAFLKLLLQLNFQHIP